jgi:hypothetical protein
MQAEADRCGTSSSQRSATCAHEAHIGATHDLGALLRTQRFFSPTTMPASVWRASLHWYEPPSRYLVSRACVEDMKRAQMCRLVGGPQVSVHETADDLGIRLPTD